MQLKRGRLIRRPLLCLRQFTLAPRERVPEGRVRELPRSELVPQATYPYPYPLPRGEGESVRVGQSWSTGSPL